MSDELVDSQVRAEPADTVAPEAGIERVLSKLGDAVKKRFGVDLYLSDIDPDILRLTHRFTAKDEDGLRNLAKDITRLFAERINHAGLHKAGLAKAPGGNNGGSLKAFEAMLGTVIDPAHAAKACSVLFGIYDLRLADAHLKSDLDSAYKRANIDRTKHYVRQGDGILIAFVVTISRIATVIGASKNAEENVENPGLNSELVKSK